MLMEVMDFKKRPKVYVIEKLYKMRPFIFGQKPLISQNSTFYKFLHLIEVIGGFYDIQVLYTKEN